MKHMPSHVLKKGLQPQTPIVHLGPFRSACLNCYMDEHQVAAAGPDSLRAVFLDAVPSSGGPRI